MLNTIKINACLIFSIPYALHDRVELIPSLYRRKVWWRNNFLQKNPVLTQFGRSIQLSLKADLTPPRDINEKHTHKK